VSTAPGDPSAVNPVQQAQSQAARITSEEQGHGATVRVRAPVTTMAPDLQAHIGQQLRAAYQRILDEPVPDRFVALLESLANKEKG
jgi:Anti-sigma factor NepR